MDSVRNLLAFCFAIACFATPMSSKALITDYTWHVCNGCSFSQASGVARAFGVGNHYVYNLPGNHIYLFAVTCESGTCYADSVTPASDAQNGFNVYHNGYMNIHAESFAAPVQYFVGSGAPHNSHGDPEDDGFVNAFDTLYIPVLETNLTNTLKAPATYTGFLASLISTLCNGFGYTIPNFSIVVTVTFHDGSQRQFSFDQATDRFVGVPNSAIDSQHNVLPDPDHHPGARQYLFNGPISKPYNPGNVATLLSSTYPDYGTLYYSCYWSGDESGGSLTCVRQQ
jgi:hypothetical protein